jgi:hypothetical protein
MNLTKLLTVHAVITLVAGVVLIVVPDLIPSAVGIHIEQRAYLICYLLAAAELSFALLSYYGTKLTDTKGLRLISFTFIAFHLSSAVVEFYAFTQGLSGAIWANIAIRIVAVILFAYYGIYKLPAKNQSV